MEPKILVYRGRIYQKVAFCFFVGKTMRIMLSEEVKTLLKNDTQIEKRTKTLKH